MVTLTAEQVTDLRHTRLQWAALAFMGRFKPSPSPHVMPITGQKPSCEGGGAGGDGLVGVGNGGGVISEPVIE